MIWIIAVLIIVIIGQIVLAHIVNSQWQKMIADLQTKAFARDFAVLGRQPDGSRQERTQKPKETGIHDEHLGVL